MPIVAIHHADADKGSPEKTHAVMRFFLSESCKNKKVFCFGLTKSLAFGIMGLHRMCNFYHVF